MIDPAGSASAEDAVIALTVAQLASPASSRLLRACQALWGIKAAKRADMQRILGREWSIQGFGRHPTSLIGSKFDHPFGATAIISLAMDPRRSPLVYPI